MRDPAARLWLVAAGLVAALVSGCRETPAEHLRRASDAMYQKDAQRALRQYRAALDALDKDESPQAEVMRARALKGAADVYHLELRDVGQAIAVYRELISECPEAPEALEAHIILAELLRVYGHDLRGAIAELTAAVAHNPPQSAELVYQVAKFYFELGDYRQCEVEAQKVVKRFETSSYVDDAMLLRAQALVMMDGQKLAAQRAYEDLAHRFPESDLAPHALFEIGRLKAEAGENERAIEVWVTALKHHPDPSVVQASIARVRQRIAQTTPKHIGDPATAFEGPRERPPARNSVEAVGGTAEEAARDRGD